MEWIKIIYDIFLLDLRRSYSRVAFNFNEISFAFTKVNISFDFLYIIRINGISGLRLCKQPRLSRQQISLELGAELERIRRVQGNSILAMNSAETADSLSNEEVVDQTNTKLRVFTHLKILEQNNQKCYRLAPCVLWTIIYSHFTITSFSSVESEIRPHFDHVFPSKRILLFDRVRRHFLLG